MYAVAKIGDTLLSVCGVKIIATEIIKVTITDEKVRIEGLGMVIE